MGGFQVGFQFFPGVSKALFVNLRLTVLAILSLNLADGKNHPSHCEFEVGVLFHILLPGFSLRSLFHGASVPTVTYFEGL